MKLLEIVFSTDFAFTTIRVATPILFAALACLVLNKGGIDAIATEGIMLFSAFFGVLGSYYFKNAYVGLMVAMLAGTIMALMFGYLTIVLRCEPILTGIALNMFASGMTVFLIYVLTGEKGSTQSLNNPLLSNIVLPGIEKIPILGAILSGHSILTYIALLLVPTLSFFFFRSSTGLRIRSVGENPHAAQSVGIKIHKYQIITLILAGSLAGLGGAFMSMGYVSFFSRDMIAGRGFIGMAAEAMGRGMPSGVLISTLIFGIADSLAVRLQMLQVPARLVQTLPYLITIIAIATYSHLRAKQKAKKQAMHSTAQEEN